MEINEKLIEDSYKIDSGIRKLQSKLTDVIDRLTEKNGNSQDVIGKYKKELADMKLELQQFLQQQKEFDRNVQSAEKEITMITNDIKRMMVQHNITVSDTK